MRTGWAHLVVAVVLLGASWPVTKSALLDGAGPAWFALGRAGLSTVSAALTVGAMGRLRLPPRADYPAVLTLGVLQIAGFFAFAHLGAGWAPAGHTAILSNAALVWTVPLAVLVTGEAISPRRWAAVGLGVAGIAVLVGPWSINWASGRALAGHGLLLLAALSWAAAIVLTRRFPPRTALFDLMPWAFAVATLTLLPLALLRGVGTWTTPSVLSLAMIGFVAAPIGTWCLTEAGVRLPLVVASVGFLAGPVVGLLLSTVWLHEPVTASIVAGTALILGGAAAAAGKGRA